MLLRGVRLNNAAAWHRERLRGTFVGAVVRRRGLSICCMLTTCGWERLVCQCGSCYALASYGPHGGSSQLRDVIMPLFPVRKTFAYSVCVVQHINVFSSHWQELEIKWEKYRNFKIHFKGYKLKKPTGLFYSMLFPKCKIWKSHIFENVSTPVTGSLSLLTDWCLLQPLTAVKLTEKWSQ